MAVDIIKVNQLVNDEQPPPTTQELLQSIINNLFGVRLLLEEIREPKLPLIKGRHVQLIQNYQETTDKLCDYRVDCRGYNALHVNIAAPYSGRFANFLVQGSDGYGGRYLTLPSPLARQGAINQNWSFDAPVSTNFATVNIVDITAVDATLAGYTIDAWPYISDGPIMPYSQGPFDLLPATSVSIANTTTTFRAAGNVGFGRFNSLVALLTVASNSITAGALDVYVQTALDDTNANFDDVIAFAQITSGTTAAAYVARINQDMEAGFNSRVTGRQALAASTRVDYFADRLRVAYVTNAAYAGSVSIRVQVYGVA